MFRKRICIEKMPMALAAFITKVRFVQTKLTASFSGITPTPAEVLSLLTQLEVYQAEALAKNFGNTGACKQLRKQIQKLLSKQVAYVNYMADGDVAVLEQSGFELSKVPTHHTVPAQGQIDRVETLEDGTIIVHYKTIPEHDSYEVQVRGLDGYVRTEISLFKKAKISNLPQGVTLNARVCGINNKGRGEWSQQVTFSLAPSTSNNTASE